MAFESKLAKSSKSTDFRISPTLCTMFNVMVDAKDQSAKLCAMEMGQEVKTSSGGSGEGGGGRLIACWTTRLCAFNLLTSCWEFCSFPLQKQFHSQIDELIEESVRDMIQLLVAKVRQHHQHIIDIIKKKISNASEHGRSRFLVLSLFSSLSPFWRECWLRFPDMTKALSSPRSCLSRWDEASFSSLQFIFPESLL